MKNNHPFNIKPDKIREFYERLFRYKQTEEEDISSLKEMIDAISFDEKKLVRSLLKNEDLKKRVDEKLFTIQNFLHKSGKFSDDYSLVAKSDLNSFKNSDFAKELCFLIWVNEIIIRKRGEEDSPEVKAELAAFNKQLITVGEAIGEKITEAFSEMFNHAITLGRVASQRQKVSINAKGNIVNELMNEGDFAQIESEVFMQNDGLLKRVAISEFHVGPNLESVTEYYLYNKETKNAIEIKIIDDCIKHVVYENVQKVDETLDFSQAVKGVSFSILEKDLLARTIHVDAKTIIWEPKAENSLEVNNVDVVELNAKENAVGGYLDNEGIEIKDADSLFDFLNNLTKLILKNQNPKDHLIQRKVTIETIYELVRKHYSQISPTNISFVITGYICGQMGWVDKEDGHNNSDRNNSYRKYLTDTVSKSLGKWNVIKRKKSKKM